MLLRFILCVQIACTVIQNKSQVDIFKHIFMGFWRYLILPFNQSKRLLLLKVSAWFRPKAVQIQAISRGCPLHDELEQLVLLQEVESTLFLNHCRYREMPG